MYTILLLLFATLFHLQPHSTSALPTSTPDATSPLENRDNLSIIRNDITAGLCKPITVIFARGTTELGNVGTFAGPPFFNALSKLLNPNADSKLAVQGVNYPATILGYLAGGDPAGASTMAKLVKSTVTDCPDTQIVLSGYSQGAQLVHLAARKLTAELASRVRAVVLFGDPDEGEALTGIPTGSVVTFCFETDLICDGAPIVLPAHLSYALEAPKAAAFVMGLVNI